jgi:hypothetical protein
METAFGASDATGAWDWKTAYDACEARPSCSCANTDVRFSAKPGLRLHGFPRCRKSPAFCRRTRGAPRKPGLPAILDADPARPGRLSTAAAITPADRVLEPSAGTGLLAILAEIAGGSLVLNELADTRADLLSFSFRPFPSRASTPPRSTIISIPPPSLPSC